MCQYTKYFGFSHEVLLDLTVQISMKFLFCADCRVSQTTLRCCHRH